MNIEKAKINIIDERKLWNNFIPEKKVFFFEMNKVK